MGAGGALLVTAPSFRSLRARPQDADSAREFAPGARGLERLGCFFAELSMPVRKALVSCLYVKREVEIWM